MLGILIGSVGLVVAMVGLVVAIQKHNVVVTEDHIAVTVNRHGFIKRLLPAGKHLLRFGERIELTLTTKTMLASGRAEAIATSDGIPVRLNWSGTYALRPEQISEGRSQRLRGLPNAEKAIARNVDLILRRLIGGITVGQLFSPSLRDRLERQLSQTAANKLQALGIVLNGLNLQTIDLPPEVSEALNKAKAIETLDGAIKQLDPTTREVVRGVYQLEEILHWDQYLPTPRRRTMERLAVASK